MSHDQHCKNLILDDPAQALAFFAPDETADGLAGAEIIPIRQEQSMERLGERFRELDTPLLVQWPDWRRAVLLFVIEAESDPRRFFIHLLAHYCLDLGELFDTQQLAEGKAEGKAQSKVEGQAALLARPLTKRSGPLAEATRARLAQADSDRLEHWAERLVDADSLDAVFDDR